jgi:hypothetical protein
VTAALLDDVERLIRNGDAETIVRCCSPAGLELAAAVLADDEGARRDFGTPTVLAAYLRSLAQPQERAARRALAEPDRPPAVPLTVAAVVHGAIAEQRRQPPAPPAEVRASSPLAAAPDREPEQVAPPVKLATLPARTGTTSARLSLAVAGELLGLPLDSLPKSAGVVEAFRSVGLRVSSSDGIRLELDGSDVERIAADPSAVEALLLRLTRAVPSLNHVGGGAIAFR